MRVLSDPLLLTGLRIRQIARRIFNRSEGPCTSRELLKKAYGKLPAFSPVVLVCGPRGVGKTTLLKACGNDTRAYVSLDVLDNRRLAREDPALFLQRFRPPLFIDEIQLAPHLFSYIKALVDEEKAPGMFWLASSHEFRKMRNVTACLAGRMAILHLAGLSLAELGEQPERTPFLPLPEIIEARAETAEVSDTASLFRRIWRGSCPGMYGKGDDMWQSFYASHVQAYMERDIRALRPVGNELVFFAFLKALAARTGQTLNCSDIAREVGVTSPTVKAWVAMLETTGVVFLLQPCSRALEKRLIKSPKVYFMDTGLACYLAGWNAPQPLEAGTMSRVMLETFVVTEIVKSWWHNGKSPRISYYRDKDRREIAVLLEENGFLHPIGITRMSCVSEGDVRAFGAIESILGRKRGHGAVLCMAPTHLPVTGDVDALPVGYI